MGYIWNMYGYNVWAIHVQYTNHVCFIYNPCTEIMSGTCMLPCMDHT